MPTVLVIDGRLQATVAVVEFTASCLTADLGPCALSAGEIVVIERTPEPSPAEYARGLRAVGRKHHTHPTSPFQKGGR